jgi:hypothetical protein
MSVDTHKADEERMSAMGQHFRTHAVQQEPSGSLSARKRGLSEAEGNYFSTSVEDRRDTP